MFKLVIQDDEGKTTVVPLIRDEITIGRKEGNTIRLTERNVSRRHARILRNNGEVQIEDLGSYNGIRVNNARIAERVSLRVSDQVQIGDYKLYLKAEGVEQVDDARTMPIERVNDAAAPTESMPAVASAAPTAQVPVQIPPAGVTTTAAGSSPPSVPPAAAAAAAAAAPLVGNPARTLVAMDGSALHNLAASRPIADPALVAKLTETASYGRLVVVSSNFAGKEFELSRPQMIVGRTTENDIVIDHRSISRNHARMVREPDTGRYTISDLQSSNGVRVNGQDYTKVELRKGDVIDLGHVRLRFIEAGEDFVFARDAEISDVAEGGSKRGLLVAVILGVVLLGAAAVYIVTRPPSDPDPGNSGTSGNSGVASNTGAVATVDAAMVAAVVDAEEEVAPIADAATVGVTPGSGGSGATAHPTNPNGSNDKATDIDNQCLAARSANNWQELQQCAQLLQPYNPQKASGYTSTAAMEIRAQIAYAALRQAIQGDDLDTALTKLRQIQPGSVLRAPAEENYDRARDKAIAAARAQINPAVQKGDCDRVAKIKATQAGDVQRALASIACVPATTNPGPGSGGTVANSQCSPTNLAVLKDKAKSSFEDQHYQDAQNEFEQVYACSGESQALTMAYTAACHGKNNQAALRLFNKLPANSRNGMRQTCMHDGFDPAPP